MTNESIAHYSAATPRPFRSFLNPVRMVRNLWSRRDLILQLTQRDIVGRYRTAKLGLLWTILTPLILLAIYTFVFSVVLEAKWNQELDETRGEFALYLYCGMLVFNLFGEAVTRGSTIVVANPNYVKKVVFPLEVLSVSGLLSALFNMVLGFVVWLACYGLVQGALPPLTMFYLPLVVLPICLGTLGISWIVASLGVFVRDVGHAVALAVQALFFATPVFYKIDRVPEQFQLVMQLNPLSRALENARGVMIESALPHWGFWSLSLAAGVLVAVVGYAFFMKSKRAFADVL